MPPDSKRAAIALLSLRVTSGLRIYAVMVWRSKTSSVRAIDDARRYDRAGWSRRSIRYRADCGEARPSGQHRAELTANNRIPTLIFMLNNPTGSSDLAQALGRDRVLLGFPGAGGTRDGHLVRYAMIAQQPTTLGELDGKRTPRLRRLVETFRQCGFPTTTSRDMDAWLKAHAFFVTAISGAIYIAGGDCRRLSEGKPTVALMAKGVREGYSAVQALGLSVAPFALKVLFTWLPPTFAIYYWRNFFASKMADYVFGRHARAASREMRELANDCRSLLEKSRVEAPALRQLYSAIDAYVS